MSKTPTNGELRVWWIPQIPMPAFYVAVGSPTEAKKVLDVLAHYDAFQYENDIKPDYCNAGGLECFAQGGFGADLEWADWYDEESGDGIDEWTPEATGASS